MAHILLEFIKTLLTSWSFTMLLIVLLLRKPINTILNAAANIINKISSIKFKDLSVILQNPEISNEAKILLIKSFSNENMRKEIKEALKSLSIVTDSFDKLIKSNKSNGSSFEASLKNTIQSLNELYDSLRLLSKTNSILPIPSLIKEIRTELESTVDQPIEKRFFPSEHVLRKLDSQWDEKNPRDFDELKKIEELLLKLLNE